MQAPCPYPLLRESVMNSSSFFGSLTILTKSGGKKSKRPMTAEEVEKLLDLTPKRVETKKEDVASERNMS